MRLRSGLVGLVLLGSGCTSITVDDVQRADVMPHVVQDTDRIWLLASRCGRIELDARHEFVQAVIDSTNAHASRDSTHSVLPIRNGYTIVPGKTIYIPAVGDCR